MKNILITDDCFIKGEPFEAGTILKNVDNSTAAQLLTSGRATLDLSKQAPEKEVEVPAKKAAKKASKSKE